MLGGDDAERELSIFCLSIQCVGCSLSTFFVLQLGLLWIDLIYGSSEGGGGVVERQLGFPLRPDNLDG